MKNRPFKFRVWDIFNKVYLQPCTGGVNFLCVSRPALWHPASQFFDSEGFIVQQFTSFLDKNGKEIYEGDIVYYNDSSDDDKAEVSFTDGMFKFNWGHDTYIGNGYRDDCEVIGNIFEGCRKLI